MLKYAVLIAVLAQPIHYSSAQSANEPTVVSCSFANQPLMILTYRGGMGANDNTLQVGQSKPKQMDVGSGMSTAEVDSKSYIFSLRPPASVTIEDGQRSKTYRGKCVSTLQR